MVARARIAAAAAQINPSIVFAVQVQCLPQSDTWFPWPTRVSLTNVMSIGSAVFAGLIIANNRYTDRPRYAATSLAIAPFVSACSAGDAG